MRGRRRRNKEVKERDEGRRWRRKREKTKRTIECVPWYSSIWYMMDFGANTQTDKHTYRQQTHYNTVTHST